MISLTAIMKARYNSLNLVRRFMELIKPVSITDFYRSVSWYIGAPALTRD